MKILVFGASNSKNSINKKLASYATAFFKESEVTIIDLNDFEMPIFSVDRERDSSYPEKAYQFLYAIADADLLIISLAENNGSYTAAFKNILDWASRINGQVFQDKPMLLLSTSTGRRGGKSVMEAAKMRFPFHGAHIIETFSLPEFDIHFSETEGIISAPWKADFIQIIEKVKSFLVIT